MIAHREHVRKQLGWVHTIAVERDDVVAARAFEGGLDHRAVPLIALRHQCRAEGVRHAYHVRSRAVVQHVHAGRQVEMTDDPLRGAQQLLEHLDLARGRNDDGEARSPRSYPPGGQLCPFARRMCTV